MSWFAHRNNYGKLMILIGAILQFLSCAYRFIPMSFPMRIPFSFPQSLRLQRALLFA